MLRLNTAVEPTNSPNRLGVLAGDNAGFPNGRRLTDDVVDIGIQALEGAVSVDERGGAPTGVSIVEPLATGDLVDSNDRRFGDTFPYLALPYSATEVAGTLGTSPSGGVDAGGGGAATDVGSVVASAKSTSTSTSTSPMTVPAVGLGLGVLLFIGGAVVLRRGRTVRSEG